MWPFEWAVEQMNAFMQSYKLSLADDEHTFVRQHILSQREPTAAAAASARHMWQYNQMAKDIPGVVATAARRAGVAGRRALESIEAAAMATLSPDNTVFVALHNTDVAVQAALDEWQQIEAELAAAAMRQTLQSDDWAIQQAEAAASVLRGVPLQRAVDQALATLRTEQTVDRALVILAAKTQRWSLDFESNRAMQTTVRQLLQRDREKAAETAVGEAVSEWQAMEALLAGEAQKRQLGPVMQQPDWLKVAQLIRRCRDLSARQTREEVVSAEVDAWRERQRHNREMQKTEQSVWDASENVSSGQVEEPKPEPEPEAEDQSSAEAAIIAELERNPASFEKWYAAFLDAEAKVASGWSKRGGDDLEDLAGNVLGGSPTCVIWTRSRLCSSSPGAMPWACDECGCSDWHGENDDRLSTVRNGNFEYGLSSSNADSCKFACGRTGSCVGTAEKDAKYATESDEELTRSSHAAKLALAFDATSTCAFAGQQHVRGVVLRWLRRRDPGSAGDQKVQVTPRMMELKDSVTPAMLQESLRLAKAVLGPLCDADNAPLSDLQPIGSYGVPGLPSKASLDLVATISSVPPSEALFEALNAVGFVKRLSQAHSSDDWMLVRSQPGEVDLFLHIHAATLPWRQQAINFRAFLLHDSHDSQRSAYAEAKRLAATNKATYFLSKAPVVVDLMAQASEWASHEPRSQPVVIGITGCTRSGKSWAASVLRDHLSSDGVPCTIICQDSFWSRAVDVQRDNGSVVSSKEEPQCFDHAAFALAIEQAIRTARLQSPAGIVIAEGIQLMHDPRTRELLSGPVYLLELERDECTRRRTAPRDSKLNPTPTSVEYCLEVVWPAYQLYLEKSVSQSSTVQRLTAPTGSAEMETIVAQLHAELQGSHSEASTQESFIDLLAAASPGSEAERAALVQLSAKPELGMVTDTKGRLPLDISIDHSAGERIVSALVGATDFQIQRGAAELQPWSDASATAAAARISDEFSNKRSIPLVCGIVWTRSSNPLTSVEASLQKGLVWFTGVSRALTINAQIDIMFVNETGTMALNSWRLCHHPKKGLRGRDIILLDAAGSIDTVRRTHMCTALSRDPVASPWSVTMLVADDMLDRTQRIRQYAPLDRSLAVVAAARLFAHTDFARSGLQLTSWSAMHPCIQSPSLFSAEDIRSRVKELAVELSAKYKALFDGKELIVTGLLLGSVYFFMELMQELQTRGINRGKVRFLLAEIAYTKTSSGQGSTHEVDTSAADQVALYPETALSSIDNCRLLLVDEVMSTGGAVTSLIDYLRTWAKPAEVHTVVMMRNTKPESVSSTLTSEALTVGFEHTPGKSWTVGYGDDIHGWLRHLDCIAYLRTGAIKASAEHPSIVHGSPEMQEVRSIGETQLVELSEPEPASDLAALYEQFKTGAYAQTAKGQIGVVDRGVSAEDELDTYGDVDRYACHVHLHLADGSKTAGIKVDALTVVTTAEAFELEPEFARWAGLRERFKKGAYAQTAEGAVGVVVEDDSGLVENARCWPSMVALRPVDQGGRGHYWIKVDALKEASESEYEAEAARWAALRERFKTGVYAQTAEGAVGVVMASSVCWGLVQLCLVDGISGHIRVDALTMVTAAEAFELEPEFARWAGLRERFKKGAYAQTAEGAVGVVVEDADTFGWRMNRVKLRLADGKEKDSIKVDALMDASEAETAAYEAEAARWAAL
eukprot:COSAG01_NODE_2418_length_7734_cov_8.527570_4_plen_1691_part_00